MSKTNIIIFFFIVAVCGVGLVPAVSEAEITSSVTEPGDRREVSTSQPDVISKMYVREGQAVKKGQILAEMDSDVLKQKLAIAQLKARSNAAIDSALTKIRIRKQKYDRLVPMLKQGHANPAEVASAESELEEAKADCELAKERKKEFELDVKRIQSELEQRIVRSPIDGIVTDIHCQPGEYVSNESRQIVSVVRIKTLKVRFYLLAKSVQDLTQGQNVQLSYGNSNRPISGTVTFVSPITDPDSGTCRVEVELENPELKLRSGTPCSWTENSKHFVRKN